MRKEDIQKLKLMEEVSKSEGIATQRELAQSLNISLGLVNAFVKRIVRKGYFKMTTIPGRRVRYLLTPKGLAEKSRLTAEYLQYSLSYYREVRLKLGKIVGDLKNQGIQKVALVGTGELAELFSLSLQEANIEISHVFSVNSGQTHFLGCVVEPLGNLRDEVCDAVCVMELDEKRRSLPLIEELNVRKVNVILGPGLDERV